jgi:hypothetical protein
MPGGTGISYPTSLTEIGIALEVTKGTAPAQPAYMVPIKGPKYKPNQAVIPDETLQGSMVQVYDLIMGMRYDEHGWDAPPYLDSFPVLLRALLGSADTKTTAPASTTLAALAAAGASTVSATATIASGSYITIGAGATLETHLTTAVSGAGPYTLTLATPLVFAQANGAAVTGLTKHQISLLNNANQGQPPGCTLWDYDGEQWRQMTAGQLDELTIKGNATGLVEYTCKWFGNAAVNNVSAPSTSFSGVQTPAPWTLDALIGGSVVGTIQEWEFQLKRKVNPIPALTGSMAYFQYFANTLEATGKLTFVEQSGSPYLANYLNGTRQALDLTVSDFSAGTALNLHSTLAQYKTGELERTKEWVEVPVEFQLLPSAADALAGGKSPILCTVANAVTTTY